MECAYDVLMLYIPSALNNQIDSYLGIYLENNKEKSGDNNKVKWVNFNGNYNRYTLPAYIKYNLTQSRVEKWYRNGIHYRCKGPAKIKYYYNGTRYGEKWYLNDKCHRSDGPAIIVWGWYDVKSEHHYKKFEKWYYEGKLHRLGYPAYTRYYKGLSSSEEWWENGHPRSGPDGPFRIEYKNGSYGDPPNYSHPPKYDDKGEILREIWYEAPPDNAR